MHQVRQDIDELTYSLADGASKDVFPRGKPRVFLYIDDLDRCPPARVIEVLEAVQLLLSTKLFIIVLGLDTRYVTRALEKEYKEILQHEGDPSGLDYIEKIIQIPYRVRPIESQSLQKYLHAQMDIEVLQTDQTSGSSQDKATGNIGAAVSSNAGAIAAPPQAGTPTTNVGTPSQTTVPAVEPEEEIELPAAVIQFKQEDLLDLTSCCQKIALTPRSIKRLVNVLKLMKIFWFRAGKAPSAAERDGRRPVKQAAMAMLALSSAYPEVMREAFIHLEDLYRQGKVQTDLFSALHEVKLPPGTAREIAWQLQKCKTDVSVLRALPIDKKNTFGQITLQELEFATFNLIRSFSFVGDPVYWSDVEESPRLNGKSSVKAPTRARKSKKDMENLLSTTDENG
jgi:hypothetical protein